MGGCLGVDIADSEAEVILVEKIGGDGTVGDILEQGGHGRRYLLRLLSWLAAEIKRASTSKL